MEALKVGVKYYRGKDIQDTLQKARQDLGETALILSTRQLRGVGIPFLKRPLWEVSARKADGVSARVSHNDFTSEAKKMSLAMLSHQPVDRISPSVLSSNETLVSRSENTNNFASENGANKAELPRVGSGNAERDLVLNGLQSEVSQLRQLLKSVKEEDALGGQAMRQLHHELIDMRQAVQALNQRSNEGLDLPETLIGLRQHLNFHGMEEKFTQRLIEQAAERLPPEKREDFTYVKIFLARMLTSLVKTTGGLKSKEAQRTVLVGCTGVGKTTTVAKLASEQVLCYKRKTALITVDTFRIGALEQLKAYARIMNLPLSVVGDRKALQEALASFKDYDVVLIDTAGRSQSDLAQMEELKCMFQDNQQLEICLVLSATTKDAELTDITRKFGCLPLSSVSFTKLDECLHCGSLFNHFIRFKLPLHYLTTGQRVPEDMEVATPERMVDLLLQISSEA